VTFGDLISELVSEASAPGDAAEPSHLVAAIAADANPFASLQDRGGANGLFGALHNDLPFMSRVRAGAVLQTSERLRWVTLLRWLMAELRQWKPDADPRMEKLTAVLLVAQANDGDGALWRTMPIDVLQRIPFADRFNALVGAFAVTFDAPVSGPEPLWEREAVNRLLAVEADCDWASMGEAWRPFQDLIHPSTLQIQAVRFLFHHDIAQLAAAVANVKQLAVAVLVAQILDSRQRLLLALESSNHFIEFACAYVTLDGRRQPPTLEPAEGQLLTQLLAKIAKDAARWRGWMGVFNAYPLRYPALHPSLGEALAHAPESAIEAYVDSVVLFPKRVGIDQGRQNVAACLRTFRANASPGKRKGLWRRAHERWLAWNFDAANSNTHLLGISWSELDYAIVGFAMECIDDAGRIHALTAIVARLNTIEDAWHKSETDIKSVWFRLLSLFQPYAHAMSLVGQTEDWLPEKRAYYPPDVANSEYLKLRYPSH